MITLENAWKSYGDTVALRGVSLKVEPGEVALLTGPSGAGKSTLLRLLFAAEQADSGEVFVAGRNVARLRRESIPYLRRNIGVVFQDFKLLKNRTARENVGLALELLGLPGRDVRRRACAALASVGLAGKEENLCTQLSGGEQQRVAVARAIVGAPAIVLADEPTGNLDPVVALGLLELFETLRARGAALLIATHDPDVVRFGDGAGWRRVRLEHGTIVDVAPGTVLDTDETGPGVVSKPVVDVGTGPLRIARGRNW